MPTSLKLQRQDATGVTYAALTDPDLTVKFRQSSAKKSLNSVPVENYTSEIIYNDDNPVVVAGVNANDAVSVRVRVSATKESAARVKNILLSMAAQVGAWSDEGVFIGFQPTTPPSLL
jgi:hypothetical protein